MSQPAASGRPLALATAWALTRAISPRPHVRIAPVNAYGQAENSYPLQQRIGDTPPAGPWAVHLTDRHGRFRLLCFDLDASTGDPAADVATLTGWLAGAGIEHLVAASGPTGGRHVWLALADPLDVATTRALARAAKASLTSLDPTQLPNAVTGCVRPPGAPHRSGGTSTVLTGNLSVLLHPTTTRAQVEQLLTAALAGQPEPAAAADLAGLTPPRDRAGRLHLPGVRRDLPPASADALAQNTTGLDASMVTRTVLIGAARAHWHCADVAKLVAHSPGLEHLRTRNAGAGGRQPRPGTETRANLARHWDNAVSWVANNPPTIDGEDPEFAVRVDVAVALATHQQGRADASPGRWARPGGLSHRRVLDALCVLALWSLRDTVEADVRRLALMCGISRETARTALLALAADGWIAQHAPAAGSRAAVWKLPLAPSSTESHDSDLSQAGSAPTGALPTRTNLLTHLRQRLQAAAHDAFTTRGGLGLHAGTLYASLTEQATSSAQLGHQLRWTLDDLGRALGRLHEQRLVRRTRTGWALPRRDHRRAAAKRLGTHGRLHDRAAAYAREREAWAWWQAELDWMHAERRTGDARRPNVNQLALVEDVPYTYPKHPRRSDGRAHFAAAHRALLERALSPGRPAADAARSAAA